jgi:dienelactone hydrolase
MQNPFETRAELISRWINDRQSLLRRETEDALRSVILDYESRSAAYWHRDYSSIANYQKSVEPNRSRWRETVGVFEGGRTELNPGLDLWYEDDRITAWWLTIDLLGSLRGRALLALPKCQRGPFPLVIAQHGVNSAPEFVFGLNDPSNMYDGYARRLAEEGFAVIAPMNISGRPARARMERLCTLIGQSLWGLEIYRNMRLLDYLESRSEIDVSRTAMYGLSLGGAQTLFTTPAEPRIKAAIVSAFFNNRINKLVIDDPRYDSFLSIQDAQHWWIAAGCESSPIATSSL